MAELKPIPTSRFYVEFDGHTEKMVKSVTEVNFSGQTAGHEKPLASTKGGKSLWQSTSGGYEENPNFTIEVFLAEGDMEFYNWTPLSSRPDRWQQRIRVALVAGLNPTFHNTS